MKKNQYSKIGLFVCVATLAASIQVRAVDLAAASGILADIAVISVQASAALAAAANTGDIDEIADARKRVDAIASLLNMAEEAWTDLQASVSVGDEDAIADAFEKMNEALGLAQGALTGDIPGESQHEQWKKSQTNTGGGTGSAYDPPLAMGIDPGGSAEDVLDPPDATVE